MSQTTDAPPPTHLPRPLAAQLTPVARAWYAYGLPVAPSWLPFLHDGSDAADALPVIDHRAVHLSVLHAAQCPPATAHATLPHPIDLLAAFAAGGLPHDDLVALADAYLFATGSSIVDLLCATTMQRATCPQLADAITDAREGAPTLAASYARLTALHAGWPEPGLMVDVLEDDGKFITTADLAYPDHKIAYVAASPTQYRDVRTQLVVNHYLALKRTGWQLVTIPWPTPPAHLWPAIPTSLAA